MTTLDDLLGDEYKTPEAELYLRLAQEDQKLITDLIAARLARGLTQEGLAELVGVSQATVSAFERLGNDPKLSTIRRYAKAVGAMICHHVDPESDLHATSEYLAHVTGSGVASRQTAAAVARHLRAVEVRWPDEADSNDVRLDSRALRPRELA